MKNFRDLSLSLAMWPAAIAWHLLMVARLRPQVSRMGDGPLTLLSFLLPFLAAGLLRWHVYGVSDLAYAAVNLVLTVPVARVLTFWGPWRMVSIYLAISTVVDLAAVGLLLLGVPFEALRFPWTQLAEVLMMTHVYWVWKKTPQSV